MTCKFRSIGPYRPMCNAGPNDCIHQGVGGYILTCNNEDATEPAFSHSTKHVEISTIHINLTVGAKMIVPLEE